MQVSKLATRRSPATKEQVPHLKVEREKTQLNQDDNQSPNVTKPSFLSPDTTPTYLIYLRVLIF